MIMVCILLYRFCYVDLVTNSFFLPTRRTTELKCNLCSEVSKKVAEVAC